MMNIFEWNMIGSLEEGRKNLGEEMPVVVYRLFEYTLRETLTEMYGYDKCIQILREAGRKAGIQLTKNLLDTSLEFGEFIATLQKTMIELKIGILRIESVEDNGRIILTVSEDLDCSGMPIMGEAVCNYDEGFIGGVLSEYSKKNYKAIEIDCWAKGDRVCRFEATIG